MTDIRSPYEQTADEAGRYRNGLLWVRTIAGMHYFGGAFDPEHMRNLSDIAARLLDGQDLPDFEESTTESRHRARTMAGQWGQRLAESEEGDERAAGDNSGTGVQ